MEKVKFLDFQNCLRLTNGEIEVVAATEFGPRIVEMLITLDETGSGVSIKHRITNCSEATIELAAWALTIMRGGGVCEVPNEPFVPYSGETLLPVRNLAVWSYTDLSDPRWSFDKDFIRLRVDAESPSPQKIGLLNKRGYVGYRFENLEFTKYFDPAEDAVYPDMNSNTELYTAGSFIEIESLAPLVKLEAGESTEHIERWKLKKIRAA